MIDFAEAYGFRFAFPAKDTAVGRCLRDYGEFGRIGMMLASQLSRGGVFIDIGANVGAYCLPVSREAKSVIAIEAHAGLAEILLGNVQSNRIANVSVIHAAASDLPGIIEFPTPALSEERNFGAIGNNLVDVSRVSVRALTIDQIAPERTSFVKIDVEGAEIDVLAGADQTLSKLRPSWLIEANSDAIGPTLRRFGYRTYWFWDPFVTPLAKATWRGKRQGDLSLLAIPSERPQPMGFVEAVQGDSLPTNTAGFEYLRAFGIRPIG